MKFASSYEPGEYESDIYAAWEADNVFAPKIPTVPIDNDADGTDDRYEEDLSSNSRAFATQVENSTIEEVSERGSAEKSDNLEAEYTVPSEHNRRRGDYGATEPRNDGSEGAFRRNSISDSVFSIVMPPPNANGNLHIGHGLTIALEDSLTRYYRLRGNSTWYVPGADHAGFETWVVYERALEKQGHTRFEYDRNELYARVWDFVAEQRGNMELQLRALGASCSWPDLTFTLDENVVDRVYTTFEKMWNDGMIYRGEKLVNFCPKHQTAFADIEVDHKDEKGTLWDIAYELTEKPEDALSRNIIANGAITERPSPVTTGARERSEKDAFLVSGSIIISTTRPETLFGDTAIAVNPNDERYKDLIGKTVKLPLTDREIPIIADEHADPEYGTGAVKITPAHDFDDFEVGERHNLERIQVISENGRMINVPDEYFGLTTTECRKKVLKNLKEQGLLVGEKQITHSVAHCYKCDTVIEPMLKEQWFIDVERLAKTAIEHLNNNEIKFYPENKQKVLINYLENLKDWNISRQIPWGIAIPMFRRANSLSENILSRGICDDGSIRSEEPHDDGREGASRESNIPGTTDATAMPDWIFDRRTHLKEIEKNGVKYIRDEDTFDTWFSSSHWPIVCTDWSEDYPTPYYPLNVMETGADILFAWVARMIMMGIYVTGKVPFKEVYLHGLVLDAHGKKMSKSKGNVINPMDLVAKYGSDAFRLGILRGRSAGMNQAFSENSVISGRNLCNKLWNISRLIQSVVDDGEKEDESKDITSKHYAGSDSHFDNSHGRVSDTEISGRARLTCCENDDREPSTLRSNTLDSSIYATDNMGEDWICRELNNCQKTIEDCIKSYRFSEAIETLYQTIWDKYADWFLESQKIYKNIPLLKTTLESILIMLHPFAPFVTETIWQNLSWTEGYIANAKWPEKLKFDPISASEFESLITIVSEVRGTLQALPGGNNAKKYALMYDNDSIVDDNLLLIKSLTKVPAVTSLSGSPRGLRLALSNHELYLDVPENIVKEYKDALTEKILAVGRELDALNARMMNPNYVDKAPAHLVKETEDAIKEKESLISRLKTQLSLI